MYLLYNITGDSFTHIVLNWYLVQKKISVFDFGKQVIMKPYLCDAFINNSMMMSSIIQPSDMTHSVL